MIEILAPWNGVPMIYKHVAVLGTYPGEVPLGPTGDTRAFDLRTGKKLWQFQTVPLPGQVGNETWLDFGWRDRSGTNVWAFYMTLDAERGILYMPVGTGRELLGRRSARRESLRQLDRGNGRRDREVRWHFQTVHHDIWDFDMPSPPVLVDIAQNGRKMPALASIGKSGYMFILEPQTGKPVFGVQERPVPKGDVPDEWYSPTQPFPSSRHARSGTSSSTKSATWCVPRTRAPARGCMPGDVGQERRLRKHRSVYAVRLSRGRCAADRAACSFPARLAA